MITERESEAIEKTLGGYGEILESLLQEGREDEARQQARRITTLLALLPQPGGELATLGVRCGEVLARESTPVDAPGEPASQPGSSVRPEGISRKLAARLILGILLFVASAMAWTPVSEYLRDRAYRAAARQSIEALEEIERMVGKGVSYQEFAEAVMSRVNPSHRNLRVVTHETPDRLRNSFCSLERACRALDSFRKEWARQIAADPNSPTTFTPGQSAPRDGRASLQVTWTLVEPSLRAARESLAGGN